MTSWLLIPYCFVIFVPRVHTRVCECGLTMPQCAQRTEDNPSVSSPIPRLFEAGHLSSAAYASQACEPVRACKDSPVSSLGTLSISFYVGSGNLNSPGPPRYPLSDPICVWAHNFCMCVNLREVCV